MADGDDVTKQIDEEFSPKAGRVGFALEDIQPATALYVNRSDKLFLRVHNSVAGARIALRGRFRMPNGRIDPFDHTLTPATDRSVSLDTFAMSEGFLLSVSAVADAGTLRRGNTFVEAGLLRSVESGLNVVQTFFADYLTENASLGWPGGRILQSVNGPGLIRSITGTDPAAAAEFLETVPTNARWRFIALSVPFVTDANAANRLPSLFFDDGVNTFYRITSQQVIVASTTGAVTAGAGIGFTSGLAAAESLPVPETFYLREGFRIRSVTVAIQAGDNYGAPQLLVEEWIED